MDDTLRIRMPEGIEFSLQTAGVGTRFVAWVIDFCVILSLLLLAGSLARVFQPAVPDAIGGMLVVLYFASWVCYGILLEGYWHGQTVGKRVMGLRVMDAQALPLQLPQVVVRNLLRCVDVLPLLYLVGGIASCLSRKHQRLGDMAAHTVVVVVPTPSLPDLTQIGRSKFNSFREYGALAARLRQQVTPAEADLALQALLRRATMEADARTRVFADLSAHFRTLVQFPLEATEDLSDEQYVRNVLEIVFSGRSGSDLKPSAEKGVGDERT